MSRLDRFLLSDGWWELRGEATQWTLARDISNHRPIVLRYSSQLWGPRPFRFNNFWLGHPGFKDLVQESRNQPTPQTWMAFKLKRN
ncbi:endonuclease/exonuclease/phosphatase family protein [Trifolium medium]|uniref:Endonuclease/exonuclease/phosphatase family protein n=1 Tax=Trifolium medium TaxID=97028 RepID=A0A392SGA5_9FABA|nr:endonuclease/exonuclease/phosphatase family protein [Trifolium medium]